MAGSEPNLCAQSLPHSHSYMAGAWPALAQGRASCPGTGSPNAASTLHTLPEGGPTAASSLTACSSSTAGGGELSHQGLPQIRGHRPGLGLRPWSEAGTGSEGGAASRMSSGGGAAGRASAPGLAWPAPVARSSLGGTGLTLSQGAAMQPTCAKHAEHAKHAGDTGIGQQQHHDRPWLHLPGLPSLWWALPRGQGCETATAAAATPPGEGPTRGTRPGEAASGYPHVQAWQGHSGPLPPLPALIRNTSAAAAEARGAVTGQRSGLDGLTKPGQSGPLSPRPQGHSRATAPMPLPSLLERGSSSHASALLPPLPLGRATSLKGTPQPQALQLQLLLPHNGLPGLHACPPRPKRVTDSGVPLEGWRDATP